MHLTTNPPSAPKRGKKSARKWDAASQGLAPQKVVDFWLASFVQSRPLHPGSNILQHFRAGGFHAGGRVTGS